MAKILVTGGAGVIGGNLVKQLISEDHEVTILDDFSSGLDINLHPGGAVIRGSITDQDCLDAAFGDGPDFVFHLAALFANQNSIEHPDKDLETSGLGIIRLLQKCTEAGVKKMLYTSSSCVYGSRPVMRESDLDFHLDTPYAITKLLGEHYCTFWANNHNFDSVIVRLFNTYGPGELPGRYRNVIPNFFKLAAQSKPLPITGTGEETRDFTYVEDTVSGMMAAMFTSTKPASIYNISRSEPRKIIDMANLVNEISGNKAGVEYHETRSWDTVLHRRGDNQRACDDLGFEPSVSLESGLEKTWQWLKTNADGIR